jgi:hypothetical protein
VTTLEVYELITQGGATHFAQVIAACATFGPYCLTGDLAVNCFVEPVYTFDADLVVVASSLSKLSEYLQGTGFRAKEHPHSVNVLPPGSELRIQFTTDARYQAFLPRSIEAVVLGVNVRVACLEDITRGKVWAYSDPHRRLSKRKKDELDLIRLAEAYPELRSLYPKELQEQLDRG